MNEIKQLNIKDAEAYELATEIAGIRGESLTATVIGALRREAELARKEQDRPARIAKLLAYGELYAKYPRSDLSDDDILGYDHTGIPR